MSLRLRRPLSAAEQEALPELIDEAAALLEGYLGFPPESVAVEHERSVRVVWARIVARAFVPGQASQGLSSMTNTTGPFMAVKSFTEAASSGGVYISRADRIALRPVRPAATSFAAADTRRAREPEVFG